MRWAPRARLALRGVLFREPHLEDGPFLTALERAAFMAREAGAEWIGVHDRLHLAREVSAEGVHLSGSSLPVTAARRVVGDSATIGVSLHAADDPSRAAGADYAFLSPVCAPQSKPQDSRDVLGAAGFMEGTRRFETPLWALGGVTLETLDGLAPIGPWAGGIACIGGVWGTDDSPIDGAVRCPLEDVEGIAERAHSLSVRTSTMFQAKGQS